MTYKGKLYGKVGGKYIELYETTSVVNEIGAELLQLREERARLLDEAAERAVQWLAEQTGNIDPAIAATNSGKWLIKLREKQAVQLCAAVRGEVE